MKALKEVQRLLERTGNSLDDYAKQCERSEHLRSKRQAGSHRTYQSDNGEIGTIPMGHSGGLSVIVLRNGFL
jgi:hypothetical protein